MTFPLLKVLEIFRTMTAWVSQFVGVSFFVNLEVSFVDCFICAVNHHVHYRFANFTMGEECTVFLVYLQAV